MISVLSILDFPPRLGYPNGFSGRAHRFLASLSSSARLHVLAIRTDAADWRPEGFLPPDVKVETLRTEEIPGNPLNGPGIKGYLSRVSHYLFDLRPFMSWPRRLPSLSVRAVPETQPDVVVIFLPYLSHLALDLPPETPVLVVLEEGWERSLEWTTADLAGPVRYWIRATERARVARLYRALSRRDAKAVVISEHERDWFARWLPHRDITVIPHGVDCGYFSPLEVPEEYDIGIFGNFSDQRVLRDALRLWDLLGADSASASARWCFVGANPPPALQALASERVDVTGFVPDLRPYYARSRVVVVPASFGTGVKTTVLEAWAMKRAVVASPHACIGLPVRHGENAWVSRTIAELGRSTMELLASPDTREDLGRAGYETVRRERDMNFLAQRFTALVTSVAESS